MKIILKKTALIKLIGSETDIGFVPTMGAIHNGHISLIKKSIKQCDKTIVSIFVNKPQFNKKTDYAKYPRSIKKDIRKIRKLKIDFLYLPKAKEIYKNDPNKKIKIDSLEKKLCGKYRPGHFRAVVDVIDRFIKIINPKRMYLGKKDMQQLIIIKNFVKKKYPKIKIVGCKTIRENNGLAFSSRNFLLSNNEKINASKIYKLIRNNKNKIINKKVSLNFIKKNMIELGAKKIDYVNILDLNKLIYPRIIKKNYKVFIAYYLKSTRLIDNI